VTPLLVAVGAGLGAALRYVASTLLDPATERRGLPLGTLLVNVVGSTLLGGFAALAWSGHEWAFAATGFCGGLTTYSSFAVQTYELGWRRGATYALVTIGLSLAGCGLGFWVVQ
jgi:fluoride exporter